MSEDTWETVIGERDFAQEEESCPYGFEFCEDPQTRDLGLCTTECETYMDEVEQSEKESAHIRR